jgi:hypothetical protein
MSDQITPGRQPSDPSTTEKASTQSTEQESAPTEPSELEAPKTVSNSTTVLGIVIGLGLLVLVPILQRYGMDLRYAVLCLVLLGAGLFLFFGAVLNLDRVLNDPRAIAWSKRLGHEGTRVLYAAVGLTFAGLGVLLIWLGLPGK